MKQLKGIFPALLTPFDATGHLNEASLRRLVSVNIARGVTGFYVAGSTGEAFLLTAEERKRVFEIVADENAGRVTLIAHVGAIGTDLTLDLGRHAVAHGADAISSIPPFYYKFSGDEVVGYYTELADKLDAPIIPYNFPALSGVTLTGPLIQRLRKHKRIMGVKFTSNDLFQLEQMKQADPDLVVYNGFDEICLAGLAMGADGAIGSTFNFMPEKFLAIRKHFMAGEMALAQKQQSQANEVIQVLIDTGKLLAGEKYLMDLQGIPCGACRSPFTPLTDTDKKNLQDVAKKLLVPN
ncbi:MAG: N-acetylneuraminate lyase [Spirochaetales bacterium]